MSDATCFDILCLSRDASLVEAKQSYKRLVKRWHPDQYGNDPEKQRIAHEKLTEINVAYRELVTLLKSKQPPSDVSSVSGTPNFRRSESAQRAPKGASLIKRMTSLFRNTKKETSQFKPATEKGHTDGPHHTTGKSAYEIHIGGGTSSDFKRVLRHAIRNQPRDTEGRQRFERRDRKSDIVRPSKSKRGAGFSRPTASPRHSRGDRVEKIRPIGRVGKIEGTDQ